MTEIQGTTYYQDPQDSELWYDDPAHIGWQGVALCVGELPQLRRDRASLVDERDHADDPAVAERLGEELAELDGEIAVLEVLAA